MTKLKTIAICLLLISGGVYGLDTRSDPDRRRPEGQA